MVFNLDADNDIRNYPANSFDYAILSQTLQATKYPNLILKELQRIAKYVIVSVPNFGYIENRLHLAIKGKMPVTKTWLTSGTIPRIFTFALLKTL